MEKYKHTPLIKSDFTISKQIRYLRNLLSLSGQKLTSDKSKPVVVTGGMGFIGSNLIRYLNALGYTNIFIVDFVCGEREKTEKKLRNIRDLKFTALIDKSDLNELYGQLRETPSMVFLFGARSNTSVSPAAAFEDYKFNKKLVEEFSDSIIVFASSAATYGSEGQKTEAALPQSPYGIYKHNFDLYLESKRNNYHHNSSAKMFSFKFFNVFGPYEFHKSHINMHSPVLRVFENACENLPTVCHQYNKLEVKRDFIYVYDALYLMFCNIFIHYSTTKRVFDIGYGNNVTFDYVMQEASRNIYALSLGEFAPKAFCTEIKFKKQKTPSSPYYQFNTKAKPDLGEEEKNNFFGLEDGIQHYAKFFLEEKMFRPQDWNI